MLTLAPRIFGYVGSFVLLPVIHAESWLMESGAAFPTYIRDRSALLATQSELRQQLALHAGAHLTVARLSRENEELRKLLNATTTSRTAAGVIGRPTALPYDVFLIDKGSQDGVQENAPVYVGGDQVIGFVAEVYTDTSVVTLVTTPGFESTVYIYGPNIYTTAVGMGSGSLRVSVPQGITLTNGDLVVIPSLDAGVYGAISVVDSVPSRPEQYGYVSIEDPLQSIRYVSVGDSPLASITFDEARSIVETVRTEVLTVPVPSGVLIDVESGATTTATTTATTSIPLW